MHLVNQGIKGLPARTCSDCQIVRLSDGEIVSECGGAATEAEVLSSDGCSKGGAVAALRHQRERQQTEIQDTYKPAQHGCRNMYCNQV